MVPHMSQVLSNQDVQLNNIIINTQFPTSDFITMRNELIQSNTVFDINNSDESNAGWNGFKSTVEEKELTI